MIRVGVCGGIGGGKSTVCAMLAERGAAVYDSDTRAKALMRESREIRDAIVAEFGERSYDGTEPNRAVLADAVFGNADRLARLDAIVHPAVGRDFEAWVAQQSGDYVVLESAILFESGFDRYVDVSVAVLAPREVRVARAMARDGAVRERVEARIAAQMSDDELVRRADIAIVNIDRGDLERDVAELDGRLRQMAAARKKRRKSDD